MATLVGSIPTRSRHVAAIGLICVLAVGRVQAQIPTLPGAQAQRQDSARLADTVKVPAFRVQPPIGPFGALWRSMLVPGWGQSILGRRVTGAALVLWEGITLTMTVKAAHQLSYAEETNAVTIAAKRQEVQDWAVLLAFNHLLAGIEAFVSSNLWDFPGELKGQSLSQDRVGIGYSVPLGH